jgi:hypothetical protein
MISLLNGSFLRLLKTERFPNLKFLEEPLHDFILPYFVIALEKFRFTRRFLIKVDFANLIDLIRSYSDPLWGYGTRAGRD